MEVEVAHPIGHGRTPYLLEHLSSEALQCWKQLCETCEYQNSCGHSHHNPEQIREDAYTHAKKNCEMGMSGLDRTFASLDNRELDVLERRRAIAFRDRDWQAVMETSHRLGFLAGESAGMAKAKKGRTHG